MSSDQEGKTALVTGAAKGLGRGVALKLAEMGANVAVNYNTSADEAAEVAGMIADAGVRSITVQADVSDLEQVTRMVREVEEGLGSVDILVNNAGIIDDGLLVRMSDKSWHRVMDVNLHGTFYCTRAVLRTMLRSRWGRIINIGSVVALRGTPDRSTTRRPRRLW